eukprot:5322450-Pyramimonas_sp.AAC.1
MDSSIDKTSHLVSEALSQHDKCAFWLRGLPPLVNSVGHLPPPCALSWSWGRLLNGAKVHG